MTDETTKGPDPERFEHVPELDVRCSECQTLLQSEQESVVVDENVFCRTCYESLADQVKEVVAAQSRGINYPMAAVGALLGGTLGALLWWGFTVLTQVAFGLVAVIIGIAVGKGTVMLSGGKRSVGLQVLSVVVSALSFFYASFLVNRSFLMRALEDAGQSGTVSYFPDAALMYRVIALDFGLFDLVFLGIVLWEGWRIPAPIRLKTE